MNVMIYFPSIALIWVKLEVGSIINFHSTSSENLSLSLSGFRIFDKQEYFKKVMCGLGMQ